MENGLPQNTVQALAETQDGFVWLGTEAGLVRFDGVEFQTYDRIRLLRCRAATFAVCWQPRMERCGLGQTPDWRGGRTRFRVFTTNDGLPGTHFGAG